MLQQFSECRAANWYEGADSTRRVCRIKEKLLPSVALSVKGTWPRPQPDLIYFNVFLSGQVGLPGDIARRDRRRGGRIGRAVCPTSIPELPRRSSG